MDIDPTTLAIGFRQSERLLIVLGGILSVLLGYRLFMNLPMLERGGGKIQLPGGISIFLTRIGPGVFFALFGTGVLAYAMHESVTLTTGGVTPRPPATAATSTASTEPGSVSYSGAVQSRSNAAVEQRQAERNGVVDTVRALRAIEAAVESGLQGQAKLSAMIALDEAKARLLGSVWDEREWGPRAAFETWRNAGMPQPAPSAIERAADIFSGPPRR